MSERQRLFFALWPDVQLRKALTPLRKLTAQCGGRAHQSDNLHLTLNFLGMVDADTRQCLELAAGEILVPPIELTLNHFGYWPRPKVVWMGCDDTPAPLLQLVKELNRVIADCGMQPETRPYRPHLTLLRKARRGPTEAAPELIWQANDFVLAESVSTPDGVKYRVLRRWALGQE